MSLGFPTKRDLVVTRAGKNSLHSEWLLPDSDRAFDVLIASFEPLENLSNGVGVFNIEIPGKKVQGWKLLIEEHADFIFSYENIAFLDDDIQVNSTKLTKLFEFGRVYGLSIWQPSLTWDSYLTFVGTAHNPEFILRFVNYVEMMAPFFSRDALRQVSPLFGYGWESGIDLMWGSAITPSLRNFAIIDAVQVKHTRPVGSMKEANGFIGRGYESDIMQSLGHFKMKWPSLVASSAITKKGRLVRRMGIAAKLYPLLFLAAKNPSSRVWRRITDHIRHQLTRSPAYSNHVSEILRADIDLDGKTLLK